MIKKAVILLLILVFISGCSSNCTDKGSAVDKFAECLAGKNVTIYWQTGCPACGAQEEMFGCAFTKIKNVNCLDKEQAIQCVTANVEKVPTWVINGERYQGAHSLEEIASLTECEYLNSNK